MPLVFRTVDQRGPSAVVHRVPPATTVHPSVPAVERVDLRSHGSTYAAEAHRPGWRLSSRTRPPIASYLLPYSSRLRLRRSSHSRIASRISSALAALSSKAAIASRLCNSGGMATVVTTILSRLSARRLTRERSIVVAEWDQWVYWSRGARGLAALRVGAGTARRSRTASVTMRSMSVLGG